MGLRTVPKDDTGLSVSEEIYGSPLTVPGEFLGSPELPPYSLFRKIKNTATFSASTTSACLVVSRICICGSIKTCILGGSHPGSLASCSRSACSPPLLCVLRILCLLHSPPPFLLEVLFGRMSDSSFCLLYLLNGTLIGQFVIEEPARPSLRRSFLREYCGRLMSANLFLSFWVSTQPRCAVQLKEDESIFCIRHISQFYIFHVNKVYSIYLTFTR